MTSLSGRTWRVLDGGATPAGSLRDRLLSVRPVDDVTRFFSPSLTDLHDPSDLPDIDEAVGRIEEALDAGELIAVFGDYDVDGLSGTALLTEALRILGGQVSTMVPNRLTDGYGLSVAAVDAAADAGARVLITVDCGVSNTPEVARATERGVDVVVCDHHELPPELPRARAVVHPGRPESAYPFSQLTGAGVALKLAQALLELRDPERAPVVLPRLLDLAALGTLADLGPLVGENRAIVRLGLAQLSRRERAGLRALLTVAKVEDREVTEEHVAFQLAPRLNAAGRIASPRPALRLLLETRDGDARTLAGELEALNVERRARTAALERDVLARVSAAPEGPVVVLADPDWSIGLLGIVATRIVERTQKPTVLFEDRGETLVGSARAPRGVDIFTPLETCRDLFLRFGGHAQAAGLTIRAPDLAAFQERLTAALHGAQAPPPPATVELATTLRPDELTVESARILREFAPFGAGAAHLHLLLPDITCTRVVPLGDGSHLRLEVTTPGGPATSLVAFRWGTHAAEIAAARTLDAAVHVGTSTYRGVERVELRVVDLRVAARRSTTRA